MTIVSTAFPAQIIVVEAEIRLVADQRKCCAGNDQG